jgi:hypothetical protein
MLSDAASVLTMPRSPQGWQPLTFHDRGVVVPFTTPALTGARLRAAERGGLELVLPEVAGPGSVGILAWDRVGTLCSPTLFDRRLGVRLVALPRLAPDAVRRAVCAEAAEGLAGPEAQEAALAAQDAAAAERERAHAHLLAQWRASVGAEAVPPQAAASALADLASLLGAVGVGETVASARLVRALALVEALPDQMPEHLRAGQGSGAAEVAAIVGAAGQVSTAARAALAAARGLAADVPLLLRRWSVASQELADTLLRAEWLLDGWPWLCRLAACADERIGRAALLAELAALAPPLPRAATGASIIAQRPELAPSIRDLLRGADWRSGVTPQDLTARNERLLAGALLLPG